MSWFKKKAPVVWYDIPEEHVEKFWKLYDEWDYYKKSSEYKFHKFVEEIIPQMKGRKFYRDESRSTTQPRIAMREES